MDNFIMPFVGHAISLTQDREQLAELQQQSADILEAAASAAAGSGRRRTRVAGSSSSKGLLPYLPLTSSCLADVGTKVRVQPSGGLLGGLRHRGVTRHSSGDGLVTKLQVYGSGESNYYYQLRRFAQDTQLLLDRCGPNSVLKIVHLLLLLLLRPCLFNLYDVNMLYTVKLTVIHTLDL
jgi:hypothetical protein